MPPQTYMVLEVNDGQVLIGPTEHSADLPKAAEVLLHHLLLVEREGDVLTVEGGAVRRGHARATLRALAAALATSGRDLFRLRLRLRLRGLG